MIFNPCRRLKRSGSLAILAGLRAHRFVKQFAEPHARFVELRFRIADRATHDFRNLVVLVSLHVVQDEHRFVSGRQLLHRALQDSRGRSSRSASNPAPPKSRRGPPDSSSGSVICSSELPLPDFLRSFISTTLTARRCSHVENADSPRNVAIFRKSWRNASCVRSSASAVFPTMRRHSE